MGWNTKDFMVAKRPLLLRGMVAALLWLLIIACFFTNIRTTILTNVAVAHIKDRTVTPKMLVQDRLLAQTAEEYVFEWATFDSINPADYQVRLKRYTGGDFTINVPEGVQRCNSASVVSVEKCPEDKKKYRIIVNINISRVIAATDASGYTISPGRIVSRNEVDGNVAIRYWKDYQESAEVTLIANPDGNIETVGIPVLKPSSLIKGKSPDQLLGTDEVPDDFKVFVSQALDMYFSGKDMENFLSADYELTPIGGYKLESATVTGFSKGDITRAVVKVNLSTEGAKNIEQAVVLEAEKKDKWLLLRLGGF